MRAFLNKSILASFIFALSAPCLSIAGNTPPDDVTNAAKEYFKKQYKNQEFSDHFQFRGFESKADLDNAQLGEGFHIFTIDKNKLLDESASLDFQALVIPTREWRFPIAVGGKARTLLKLRGNVGIGIWRASEMEPSSTLTAEINGIMATWPASSGYSYRYITAPQAAAEVVELSKDGKVVSIIPLSTIMAKPERARGEFKAGDLRNPQEILKEWQIKAKQNREEITPPSVEVIAAAKKELQRVKDYGISKHLLLSEFKTQAEIDSAELGEGFQGYSVDYDKLSDESSPLDFKYYVQPTGFWSYPLIANGKNGMIISGHFSDGVWNFSSSSSPGLANEISGIRATWPASAGYQFRYIRCGFYYSELIEISQGGKVLGVIPMDKLYTTPGRSAGEFKQGDLHDPLEILKELRSIVKQRNKQINSNRIRN